MKTLYCYSLMKKENIRNLFAMWKERYCDIIIENNTLLNVINVGALNRTVNGFKQNYI